MAAKDEVGRNGEELAARYLGDIGLTVMTRNWRCREGELDIVAVDGRDLAVVCEVKTRSGVRYGSGAEAVDATKRRRIRRLATLWLAEHQARPGIRLRFDVISVLWTPGAEPRLTHIAGAF
ncbi:YraN family protein [Nakamurella deserti]|uniref:YraN family protein n=1 Tax=Nakamurella deserti TaxID=2164074 RepID=UPI000DBE5EB2|nr:YraN family protein [Nakamurella deserti]